MGVEAHRQAGLTHLAIGVFSMSSTRTLAEDESGHWIARRIAEEGHAVAFHAVLPDDAAAIRENLVQAIHAHRPGAVVMTGGTGIAPKDATIEAVKPLFQKELSAFQILFAYLSFQEIGAAAVLSRATAGIIGTTAVFCLPGSLKACSLGCDRLIFPELGHLSRHLVSG